MSKMQNRMVLADLESKAYIRLSEISDAIHQYNERGKDLAEELFNEYDEWFNSLGLTQRVELSKRGVREDYIAIRAELKNFEDELDRMSISDGIKVMENLLKDDPKATIEDIPVENFKIWLEELEKYRRKDILGI